MGAFVVFLTLLSMLCCAEAQNSAVRGTGDVKGNRNDRKLQLEDFADLLLKKSRSSDDVDFEGPPFEPPLAGVLPGREQPKLLFAQDIDYPPYAELGPANEDFPVSGFGADFAEGLMDVCDVDVTVVQTQWSRCWQGDRIGEGLALGEYHACTTYSHASGIRNRFLEFSRPILDDNKAAGVLVRLENGEPFLDGNSNLDGVRVVDVVGFAPTTDNLAIVTNDCINAPFEGYTFVPPLYSTDFPNDDALRTLLEGGADAMWVYSDQAERLNCANNAQPTPWDCSLWDGLGTDFAYVQTGMFEWARGGTTLTISKKAAGIPDTVNPCIEKFLLTEKYYDLCVEYDLVSDCYPNEYFPDTGETEEPLFNFPTNELTTECSSGYCSCP